MAVNFLTNKDKAEFESKLGTKANKADVAELLDKGAKIQKGDYTGGGWAGEKNPNVLNFDFEPQVLFIQPVGGANSQHVWKNGCVSARYDNSSTTDIFINWNGNSVSWYVTGNNNTQQLNSSGKKYNYVAIG